MGLASNVRRAPQRRTYQNPEHKRPSAVPVQEVSNISLSGSEVVRGDSATKVPSAHFMISRRG